MHLDGATLSFYWAFPFAGILLSIALFPLIVSRFWHRHYGKVALFWALAFILPCAYVFGVSVAGFNVLEVALHEYIPFIILLFTLFVVSGGIQVTGTLRGTPVVNTGFLVIGTLLASIMGTTGAAMLLIRPLINANRDRHRKVHIFIFFIFLVANIGGSLTPLGDPPLFVGFLKGVPFFWPTVHLFLPMLLASSILIVIFYFLDRYIYQKHASIGPVSWRDIKKIGFEGRHNLILLVLVVLSIFGCSLWKPAENPTLFGVEVELPKMLQSLILLAIAYISYKKTSDEIRKINHFSWFPILEVAKLFAAIFITIVPVIAMLKAGEDGMFRPLVEVLNNGGQPVDHLYFWITGILSAFLDNAPTYLVFFNMLGGDAAILTTQYNTTLTAISAGAVFMGALTYIGNAPNFMVRAIAEERGIKMPSFIGYIGWSIVILVPVFAIIDAVFFG